MRLGTGCAGAAAGVKSTIWWGKRLAPPSFLSSMALQLSWPLSPFWAHFALSLIPLSHPLGPFLLPCSALTSASRKLLAASDPSLLAKLRRMRIRPHPFWAAISSSNTSLRPNERKVHDSVNDISWEYFSAAGGVSRTNSGHVDVFSPLVPGS